MQQTIKSFVPFKDQYQLVDLFGYTTKGLPGLEVVGLPKNSRMVKEKLIYLARKNGLKIPRRRYIICLDNQDSTLPKGIDYSWLEAPLFVLYLTLAQILPLHQLENCFCAGKINLKGELEDYPYNWRWIESHPHLHQRCFLLASPPPRNHLMCLQLPEMMKASAKLKVL